MTRHLLPMVVLVSTASTAFAGGVAPPPPPPVYVEPERCTQAFDCFYIGVELGFGRGSLEESTTLTAFVPVGLEPEGGVYGVFAGYNVQNDSFVFGGEVRFLHTDLVDDASGFEVNSIVDLRGRVGFVASEQLMVYGAAGFSMAEATAAGDFDMDGFNYGIGAEYNINDSFFVGVDLTGRQLEGSDGIFDYDGDVNTATLRAGFRF